MAYGTTPVDASATPIPMSSGFVPGASNPDPVGGTATYTDSGSNKYTHVAVNDLEPAGYIALTSPAANTTANTDTTFTFSAQVNHVIIQNNSSVAVKFAFDVAASAGSMQLQPGSFMVYNKRVTAVHFLTVPAVNVNGTSAGNIVLLGAN